MEVLDRVEVLVVSDVVSRGVGWGGGEDWGGGVG